MKARSFLSLIFSGLLWFSITCFSNAAFGSCVVTATKKNVTCFNACDGEAYATVNAGTAPYTFEWRNGSGQPIGQTNDTATGLCAGTYIIAVTDGASFDCNYTITIDQPDDITFSLYSYDESCAIICDGSIVMSTAASGGNPPYDYLWSNNATTSSITGICAGIYDLTVTDSLGCTKTSLSYTVLSEPGVTINSLNNEDCPGACNGNIGLNVQGQNQQYDWVWSNGGNSTNHPLSGLCSDSYYVTITSDVGPSTCITAKTFDITAITTLSVSISTTDEFCGNNNGTADATVSGGGQPFTFNWSTGDTSSNISGLTQGFYVLTLTNGFGCVVMDTIVINDITGPTISSMSATDESCGNADGDATVSAAGGFGNYIYQWSNNANTSTITGLSAGTYFVTVTDGNGCTAEDSVIVGGGSLSTSYSITDETCANADGTAKVFVTGGTQPYMYEWYDQNSTPLGINSDSASSLAAGQYSVEIMDDLGCMIIDYISIGGNGIPDIDVGSSTVFDTRCDYGTGYISGITIIGGTPPFTYLWDDPSNQTTINAINLIAGGYILMVTDSMGCNDIDGPHYVNNFPSPNISITKEDETCSNADGKATATASGGVSPYTFYWNTGETDSTITGLSAGIYFVTITDNNGCSRSDTTIISNIPGPSLTINTIPVKCDGGADGAAMTNVSGGTPPYTYLWNNNATSSNIGNLSAGTYSVIVTDANACTISDTIIISSPPPVTATFNITDPSCFGYCNGKIEANIIGGIPPYLLNGQSNTIVSGVCAGNYPVVVKDSNNCTFYNMASVNDPPMMEFTIDVTDASCGESDGSAVISGITNSTPPYLYQWTSGSTDSIADSLGAGMYMVTVTDTSGCGNFGLAVVSDQDGPTITVNSVNDVTCHGNGDGAITIDVTGGITPYTYFWSNGAMVEDISNLTAGPYEITIYDANGCTASKSIPVFGPQRIELAMTKVFPNCGQNDGMVAVAISEGTPPYSINWSTGDTTDTITNLMWGVYHVTVTDNNGCVRHGAAPLGEQGGTSVQVDSVMDVACGGSGAISVTVNGGTPPFNYFWYKDSVLVDSVEDIQGVSIGTYDLIVSDSNGCMGATNATISGIGTNPEPICIVTVDSITGTNVIVWEKNNTSNIASYNIYKESTMAGVYYLIDNVAYSDSSLYSDTVSNPKTRAWRYKISVIDSCGNESDFSEVHKTMHLTINLSITPNEYNLIWDHYEGIYVPTYVIERYHPSTDWDSLDAVPSNLTSYIDDASPLPDQNNIYYRIRVANPSGCSPSKIKNYNSSKSNTSAISLGEVLSATATSTDASQGNCDGTATASASGGSAPYTYLWNDPMAQTTETATGLCPDTFLVIVVDAFGDTIIASAIVIEISALTLTASSTDADIGSSNGTATVVATGGTPPYTYLWDASAGFQTTPTAGGLFAGTYTVTVTESLGDNESIDVTVNELTSVAELTHLNKVLIYPNPGLGELVIEIKQAQQNYGTVQIYNLVGKLVWSQTINSQKTYIDLSNEGPGIYTLKLKEAERVIIRKIIIE